MYIYIYIYIYIYMCVCVCVCVYIYRERFRRTLNQVWVYGPLHSRHSSSGTSDAANATTFSEAGEPALSLDDEAKLAAAVEMNEEGTFRSRFSLAAALVRERERASERGREGGKEGGREGGSEREKERERYTYLFRWTTRRNSLRRSK